MESLRALWYQDTHHDFFHGILLPPVLGYNDFRQKKEKEPRLSVESFEYHIQQLTGNRGVYSIKVFDTLRNEVGILVDARDTIIMLVLK